jgi:putative tricarboxylic transport membrane protein
MKLSDAFTGALLAALGIAVLLYSRGFPQIHGQEIGPAVFPSVVAAVMLGCGVILMFNGWKARAERPWYEVPGWMRSRRHTGAFITVIAAAIVYILLGDIVGFFIIGSLTLLVLFLVLGVKPVVAVITAIIATAVIWYAFYKLLRVPLPWGIFTAYAF